MEIEIRNFLNSLGLRVSDVFLIVVSVVVGLVACEVVYRAYLTLNLDRFSPVSSSQTSSSNFSFSSYPALWVFDVDAGWTYRPEGHFSGAVKDGRFSSCGKIDLMNARGQIASVETDWNGAEVRGALIGSSYTMGPGPNGRLFHEVLGDNLSRKLGRSVLVENFGRDSYGVLQMFDLAALVARKHRPDFIVIAFNSATISMNRHWRFVKDAGDGFYDFYMMPRPGMKDPTPQTAYLHQNIISERVTESWCKRMMEAVNAGDEAVLRDDPVMQAMTERHQLNQNRRHAPKFSVDLWSPEISFLYKRLFHGNPFWSMNVYETPENSLRPLVINDYGQDARFSASVRALAETGVPYFIVYIPAYPEVLSGKDYDALGTTGTAAARERSLVASLGPATGHRVLSILSLIGAPRSDAAEFAEIAKGPNQNWHPNKKGVVLFAREMSELIIAEHFGGKGKETPP